MDLSLNITSIDLNGGTIRDLDPFNNDAILSLPNLTSGIIIDTNRPTITSTTISADNTTLKVTFSEDVYNSRDSSNNGIGDLTLSDFTLTKTGGVASVSLSDISKNSQNVWDLSLDISSGFADGSENLIINPASTSSIYDWAGNYALTNQSNNSVVLYPAPTLSGFDISSNNVRPTSGTMAKYNDIVTLIFTANQTIDRPTLTFKSGGVTTFTTTDLSYNSNDNINWSVSYSVGSGDTDGTVSYEIADIVSTTNIDGPDVSGTSGTDTSTSVTVDLTRPTVKSVSSTTADGIYKPGSLIKIVLTCSEPIVIGPNNPTIILSVGGFIYNLSTLDTSHNDTTKIIFDYTVQNNHYNHNLNIGYPLIPRDISDNVGNLLDISYFPTDAPLAGVLPRDIKQGGALSIDGYPPAITTVGTSVTQSNPLTTNGDGEESNYIKQGDIVDITLVFDKLQSDGFPMYYDASYEKTWSELVLDGVDGLVVTGSPYISIYNSSVNAFYVSSSGRFLTFRYVVPNGDNINNLTLNSLVIPSGSEIRDVSDNNGNYNNVQGTTLNSFTGSNTGITVDTTPPTFSISSSTVSNGESSNDSSINLTITLTEVPYLMMNLGNLGTPVNKYVLVPYYYSFLGSSTTSFFTFNLTPVFSQAYNYHGHTIQVQTSQLRQLVYGIVPDIGLYSSYVNGHSHNINITYVDHEFVLTIGSNHSHDYSIEESIDESSNQSISLFLSGENYNIISAVASNNHTTFDIEIEPDSIPSDQTCTITLAPFIGVQSVVFDRSSNPLSSADISNNKFIWKHDSVRPSINSISNMTITDLSGTTTSRNRYAVSKSYTAGVIINFTINFDEQFTLNRNGSSGPKLGLNNNKYAQCTTSDGSGNSLDFTYTIEPGDDVDLLNINSQNPINLNYATILDHVGNSANFTTHYNRLRDYNIEVDTIPPVLSPDPNGDDFIFGSDKTTKNYFDFSSNEPGTVTITNFVSPTQSDISFNSPIDQDTTYRVYLLDNDDKVYQFSLTITDDAGNSTSYPFNFLLMPIRINDYTITMTHQNSQSNRFNDKYLDVSDNLIIDLSFNTYIVSHEMDLVLQHSVLDVDIDISNNNVIFKTSISTDTLPSTNYLSGLFDLSGTVTDIYGSEVAVTEFSRYPDPTTVDPSENYVIINTGGPLIQEFTDLNGGAYPDISGNDDNEISVEFKVRVNPNHTTGYHVSFHTINNNNLSHNYLGSLTSDTGLVNSDTPATTFISPDIFKNTFVFDPSQNLVHIVYFTLDVSDNIITTYPSITNRTDTTNFSVFLIPENDLHTVTTTSITLHDLESQSIFFTYKDTSGNNNYIVVDDHDDERFVIENVSNDNSKGSVLFINANQIISGIENSVPELTYTPNYPITNTTTNNLAPSSGNVNDTITYRITDTSGSLHFDISGTDISDNDLTPAILQDYIDLSANVTIIPNVYYRQIDISNNLTHKVYNSYTYVRPPQKYGNVYYPPEDISTNIIRVFYDHQNPTTTLDISTNLSGYRNASGGLYRSDDPSNSILSLTDITENLVIDFDTDISGSVDISNNYYYYITLQTQGGIPITTPRIQFYTYNLSTIIPYPSILVGTNYTWDISFNPTSDSPPYYSTISTTYDLSGTNVPRDVSVNRVIQHQTDGSDVLATYIPDDTDNALTVYASNLIHPVYRYQLDVYFDHSTRDVPVSFDLSLNHHLTHITNITYTNNMEETHDTSGGTLFYNQEKPLPWNLTFDISSNMTADVSGVYILQHDTNDDRDYDVSNTLTQDISSNDARLTLTVNLEDKRISVAGRYQIIYYSHSQFAIDPNETSNNMELGTFTFHQPTYPQSIQVSIIDPTPLTLSYPSTLPPYHTDISNTVVHWFLTDFSSSSLPTITTKNTSTDRSFMYNVVDISNNRSYLGRINFSDTSNNLFFGTSLINYSLNETIGEITPIIDLFTNLKNIRTNSLGSVIEVVSLGDSFITITSDKITQYSFSGLENDTLYETPEPEP